MNEDRITWPLAARDAREAALESVENGDDRDADDIAHEYADGCADVIYNHRALSLYMDSTTVSDYAEEATGYVDPDERTPERIASVCAYLAIRSEYVETLEGLRMDPGDPFHIPGMLPHQYPDAEGVYARMRARVEYGNAYMRLVDQGHVKLQEVAQ